MARIFAGELSRIDQEVLAGVQRLPDDFWVFAEFHVGRNVDWLIIRPIPGRPSVLIMTECKRVSTALRGADNGEWERLNEAGAWEPIPASGRDLNPYWQAVNTANALRDWLWNNQRIYRATLDLQPQEQFKAWPDLLILSPPGVEHRLPNAPTSRYGRWLYSIEEWLRHLLSWNPTRGISFAEQEVLNLANALRLTPLTPVGPLAPSQPAPNGDLLMRLQQLEQRVALLESQLGAYRAPAPYQYTAPAPYPNAGYAPPQSFAAPAQPYTVPPRPAYQPPRPATSYPPHPAPAPYGTLVANPPQAPAAAPASSQPPAAASLLAPAAFTGTAPLPGEAGPAGAGAADQPAPNGGRRTLGPLEEEALRWAVEQARQMGKSRAIPAILQDMNLRLGYNLWDRQYNEFGSAGTLFEAARRAGLIKFGPNSTIYLPDEEVPESQPATEPEGR